MAAEAGGDLSKADKRELKWQRKQDKLKAAAEAAGKTYVAPSKKESTPAVEKMGKRKKRKLAALEQAVSPAEQPSSNGTAADTSSPIEPALLGMASQPDGQGSDAQARADQKAAKKAKKAAASGIASPNTNGTTVNTAVADVHDQPKKKKKKKSAAVETATPEQPVEAEAAATKKVKKAKTGLTGKITVRQEAVLASVGTHCHCHLISISLVIIVGT